MKSITDVIAENIKLRRKELGLTQAALGDIIGYSSKAVSKWESGSGAPPTVILPNLAATLQTTVDRLMSENSEQSYYLGIDGGGTKTEFALADAEGKILRRTVLGPSNPNDIGISATLEVLRSGITEVCGELPMRNISVFAGIAGISANEDIKNELGEFLRRFGFFYANHGSDTMSAISASLGKRNGIAVILGTGSVTFAQIDGKTYSAGGYGYLFGDAGSGFSFGKQAILSALSYEDGSGNYTRLYDSVKKKCGTASVKEKLGHFYSGGKRSIAEYASLVFEAYRNGDEKAVEIITHDLDEVARTVHGVSRYFSDISSPIQIRLCGGLCAHSDIIIPILTRALADSTKQYDVAVCNRPIIHGTLLLAGMPDNNNKGENRNA